MDRLESTTLARATVGQTAAAEVRAAAAVLTVAQQPSLTVTTAFRTVEVPIGPGGVFRILCFSSAFSEWNCRFFGSGVLCF